MDSGINIKAGGRGDYVRPQCPFEYELLDHFFPKSHRIFVLHDGSPSNTSTSIHTKSWCSPGSHQVLFASLIKADSNLGDCQH